MNKMIKSLLILFTIHCSLFTASAQTRDFTRWVNPFIGTGGHGHTFPGATMPFACMWANRMPRRVLPVRRADLPVLDPDRETDHLRGDADLPLLVLRNVGVGHRRRMLDQRLGAPQAHRKLDQLDLDQDYPEAAEGPR